MMFSFSALETIPMYTYKLLKFKDKVIEKITARSNCS